MQLAMQRRLAVCLAVLCSLVILTPALAQRTIRRPSTTLGRPSSPPINRPGTTIGGPTGLNTGRPGGTTIGGGAIGNPGFPRGPMQIVWYCKRCNQEVGRGPARPTVINCACTRTGMGIADLPLNQVNVDPPPATNDFNPFVPPTTSPSSGGSDTAATVSGVMVALGVGILMFGLLVLGGLVGLIVYVQRNSAPAPRRQPRRDRDD